MGSTLAYTRGTQTATSQILSAVVPLTKLETLAEADQERNQRIDQP